MHSMQRTIGRKFQKNPGDNAKTSVLLKDYDDAEQILTRLVEQVGSWRAAWMALAHAQLGIATELESLYDPIVGAADESARASAPTPELLLERTLKLKEAYSELKTDMMEEIAIVDTKIIKPVSDARDSIAPVRKTIKKREKLRLDYENVQTDVTKLQRKPARTPKDEKSLAKLEAELGPRADAFHDVDERLKEVLPPMIAAAFNLLPPVLATIIVIQNRLLGLYYTTLHTFCEDFNFPLPPPAMEDVIEMWSSEWGPVKIQIEAIPCVASGKGARMLSRPSTDLTTTTANRRSLAPPLADGGTVRRASTGLISSSNTTPTQPPRPQRIPSAASLSTPQPAGFSTGMATDFTTASRLGQAGAGSMLTPSSTAGLSPAAARMNSADYFGRSPSSYSNNSNNNDHSPMAPSPTAISQVIQAKKKPPPPPPPKPKPRAPAPPPDEYVVALYDYAGQGPGDLSFHEGDRIKIVKRTATAQDWWTGELGGRKGSFPANYCQLE